MNSYKYIPIFEHVIGNPRIKRMDHPELPSMLRARTALAFLHHHNLFASKKFEMPEASSFKEINDDFNIWYPKSMSEEALNGWQQMYYPHFERELEADEVGGLLIAVDPTASFADQSFTVVLFDELKPHDMRQAFEPSMRWLNDRKSNLRVLETMWFNVHA
jgi:hypothetical protein